MSIKSKILSVFAGISALFTIVFFVGLYAVPAIADAGIRLLAEIILIAAAVIVSGVPAVCLARSIEKPITELRRALGELAFGNTDAAPNFGRKGEFGDIRQSFVTLQKNVAYLFKDAADIGAIIGSDNSQFQIDTSKYTGRYGEIFVQVDQGFETLLVPLQETTVILQNLSVFDFTKAVSGNYEGVVKQYTDLVNNVRNRFLDIENVLVEVENGNLSKISKLQQIGRQSENDKMTPAVLAMMEELQQLVNDTEMLADAATKGDLSARSDASKHSGDYRKIVDGFNRTLDAIVGPINDIMHVMREMSIGNNSVSVTMECNGDLKELKDAVNLLAATINNAVSKTEHALSELSQGHLNMERMPDFRGDWLPITNAVNKTIDGLNESINNINLAAEQVSTGANQISQSSQALSQGATEQASSIEELSSSVTEVSSQTKQNATNAGKANTLALKVKGDAETGSGQMQMMLKSMSEINESSSNIAKVIKVIDDIAFQTNMLALNAAVEAARAGQYGKGFAVVAEEVRSLAAKSANAAKETEELIEGSIAKAAAGTKIAGEMDEALVKIVSGIGNVTEIVADISSASTEQATAISQINIGIEQVSQVIQTNSATAEEGAASSEELSSQADLLQETVGRFVLRDVGRQAAATSAHAPQKNSAPGAAKTESARNTERDHSGFDKY